MSWISQFVNHNRDWAGNALKNIAPAAFLIPGLGPLAAAGIAGAGSALGRGIQHGANLGNIARQGATGAAISSAGSGAMGLLHGALGGGAAGATSGAATGGVQGVSGVASPGQLSGALDAAKAVPGPLSVGLTPSSAVGASGIPGMSPLVAGQGGVPSAIGAYGGYTPSVGGASLGGAARGIGSFAKDNPSAIGMGLQGLGHLATAGPENRLTNARAAQTEWETEQERQRQIALEPLRRALAGQLSQPRTLTPWTP